MRLELIEDERDPMIDPRKLLGQLFRAWPLFALMFILMVGSAAVFHSVFPPIYEAQVGVIVEDPNGNNAANSMLIEPRLRVAPARNYFLNEEVRLGSYGLVLEALKRLDHHAMVYEDGLLYKKVHEGPFSVLVQGALELERSTVPYDQAISVTCSDGSYHLNSEGEFPDGREWFFDGKVLEDTWFDLGKARVKIVANAGREDEICSGDFGFMLLDIEEQAIEYAEDIEVKQGKMDASAYRVNLTGGPSPFVIQLLDSLAAAFCDQEKDNRGRVYSKAISQLDLSLQGLTGQLDQALSRIDAFKRSNGITSLSHEGSILLDQGFLLGEKVNELELKQEYYALLQGILDQADESAEPISPEAYGLSDGFLARLTQEWVNLLAEKRELERAGATSNPAYQRANDALKDLKVQMRNSIEGTKETEELRLAELRKDLAGNKKESLSIPAKEKSLLEYERDYRTLESTYQTLSARRAEAKIALNALTGNAMISEPAHLTDFDPFLPDPLLTIVAIITLTLFSTVLMLILRGLFGGTVRNEEQLERYSGHALKAVVSHHARKESAEFNDFPDSKYNDEINTIALQLKNHVANGITFVGLSAPLLEELVSDVESALEQDMGSVHIMTIESIDHRSKIIQARENGNSIYFIAQRGRSSIDDIVQAGSEQGSSGFFFLDSLKRYSSGSYWNNEPRSVWWRVKKQWRRI